MKRVIFGLVILSLSVSGCTEKRTAPNPAAVAPGEAPVVAEKKVEPAPVEEAGPAEPVSKHAALRDALKKYSDLAVRCEKRWISKVDPDRLDKWELPVDVSAMEDDCDKLIFNHKELVEKHIFKGAALDGVLERTAKVADLYSHLAFRSRKVGVRDRLPFKKMLAGLRDRTSKEIKALTEQMKEVLELSDDELVQLESGDELIARADASMKKVDKAMKDFVVGPRKKKGPVFKYCLDVSGALVARSSEALAADQAVDQKLKDAAAGLAKAWGVVSGFYAGDYLAEEEAKAGFLAKGLKKAVSRYEKTARRYR